MTDRPAEPLCAKCGHPRKEHSYNGVCYGLCGEFVDRPAEPTTEIPTTTDLIDWLRGKSKSESEYLLWLTADRLASLTAAKEAAEKQLAYCLKMRIGLGEKLDAAEKQCEELWRAVVMFDDKVRDVQDHWSDPGSYTHNALLTAQLVHGDTITEARRALASTSPKEGT